MKLKLTPCELALRNVWKIANASGSKVHRVVLFELSDESGVTALGEAAPSSLYKESVSQTQEFCSQLDLARLRFDDIPGSMAWLESLPNVPAAVRCGLNTALWDGAGKRANKAVYDLLGLGFRNDHHVTSFSIGIDTPEIVYEKTLAAAPYPVLKLKIGDPRDRENLAAVRAAAPNKPIRVDANEGWKTKEEALAALEQVAADGNIQFVEQPMPRTTPAADLAWLKARSPLPLFADESCHTVRDIPHCAECFHGVNVKLVKTGGISMAHDTLQAARKAGLQTMIGCMIETSVLISAAAQLAELADYLDVDGNLLTTNDPFLGVTAEQGILSFAQAPAKTGLRVSPIAQS
jgi:L-alanine-DL-glutamate epimerase-like enolase superfamily enzyme